MALTKTHFLTISLKDSVFLLDPYIKTVFLTEYKRRKNVKQLYYNCSKIRPNFVPLR